MDIGSDLIIHKIRRNKTSNFNDKKSTSQNTIWDVPLGQRGIVSNLNKIWNGDKKKDLHLRHSSWNIKTYLGWNCYRITQRTFVIRKKLRCTSLTRREGIKPKRIWNRDEIYRTPLNIREHKMKNIFEMKLENQDKIWDAPFEKRGVVSNLNEI